MACPFHLISPGRSRVRPGLIKWKEQADDLAKVIDIARSMVTRFGMVEAPGQIAYEDEPQRFLGLIPMPTGLERRYNEETARKIDDAVRELIDKAFEKAVSILKGKRAVLDKAAEELLQRETLGGEELATLFGGDSPVPSQNFICRTKPAVFAW